MSFSHLVDVCELSAPAWRPADAPSASNEDALDVDMMDVDATSEIDDGSTSLEISSDQEAEDSGSRRRKRSRPDEDFGLADRARVNIANHFRFSPEVWEREYKLEIVIERVKQFCYNMPPQKLATNAAALGDQIWSLCHFWRFATPTALLMTLALNGIVTFNMDLGVVNITPKSRTMTRDQISCFCAPNSAPLGWDFKLALMRAFEFFAHSVHPVKGVKETMESLIEISAIHFDVSPNDVLLEMHRRGHLQIGPPRSSACDCAVAYPLLTQPRTNVQPLCSQYCKDSLA